MQSYKSRLKNYYISNLNIRVPVQKLKHMQLLKPNGYVVVVSVTDYI